MRLRWPLFRAVAALAWIAVVPGLAQAQAYPSKPITVVVPFTAGGIVDMSVRTVAKKLSDRLGQPIVVDNRPGAGGATAGAYVARAPPDGYTLYAGTRATQVTNALLQKNVPIPAASEFASIHTIFTGPTLLVAHPSAPYHTVAELVAYAKAHPGKVNFGTAGNGTAAHLTSALFMQLTGTSMVHVPYRGSAPAITDLLAGTIELAFDYPTTTASFIKAGKLRPLALLDKQRFPGLPDVPTAAEVGLPGADPLSWMALFAPVKTPQPIVARLVAEMSQVMADPEVRQKLIDSGSLPLAVGGKDLDALIAKEQVMWSDIMRRVNISVE